jgi:hypothetical protein
MKNAPTATVPLYEYRQTEGGRRAYLIDPVLSLAGYERVEKPFCLVWR